MYVTCVGLLLLKRVEWWKHKCVSMRYDVSDYELKQKKCCNMFYPKDIKKKWEKKIRHMWISIN